MMYEVHKVHCRLMRLWTRLLILAREQINDLVQNHGFEWGGGNDSSLTNFMSE